MRSVSATNGLNTAEGGPLGAPPVLVGFMIGAVLESAILLVIDGVRGVVTETTVECTTARLNCYILATDQLRAGLWPSVDLGLAGVPLGSPRPHTTWARVGPSACRAVSVPRGWSVQGRPGTRAPRSCSRSEQDLETANGSPAGQVARPADPSNPRGLVRDPPQPGRGGDG